MADTIIAYGPFTAANAAKFIRANARGRSLFVSGGAWLPTTPGRGFEATCLVPVSRPVALKYVADVLRPAFEEKGARLSIRMSDNCLFVG